MWEINSPDIFQENEPLCGGIVNTCRTTSERLGGPNFGFTPIVVDRTTAQVYPRALVNIMRHIDTLRPITGCIVGVQQTSRYAHHSSTAVLSLLPVDTLFRPSLELHRDA